MGEVIVKYPAEKTLQTKYGARKMENTRLPDKTIHIPPP
jgi:hypothetical protein